MKQMLTFVAIVPELSSRTRCLKMAILAAQSGMEIEFWGWDRDGHGNPQGEASASVCQHRRLLVSGGGFSSRRLLPYYVLWVVKVFWATLRHRPATVQALGLESAFPVAVASCFCRNTRLIFDDADRLSYCHKMPAIARRILMMMERWTMRRSLLHIVPGPARYPDGLVRQRTVVLKNNPSSQILVASESIEMASASEPGTLTLLALGWIGDRRGAKLMDEIAKHFANDSRLRILAAGRLTGDAAKRFIRRENVQYFGEIANESALSLYRIADLVLTFYDPEIRINRYAEPNKWGDCVQQGVPFLVNSGIYTAQEYVKAGAAFVTPYDEPDAACELVLRMIVNPECLTAARKSMARFKSRQISFDKTYASQVLAKVVL